MSASANKKQVAIVTGASSGIGLGITRALLERGYRVVANSRTISKSKELKPPRTSSWWTVTSAKKRRR